ncbi:MAG: hypothetical protein PWQ20_67 [Thermotogaceae bacterium]|nr:hypothetical protein [Thermotogaceae bacterium]MDN5336997.1 hypothetical protein [Thermotogaceae bacterium]
MLRKKLLLFLVFLSFFTLAFSDFWQLYKNELLKTSEYLTAVQSFKQAELNLKQFENFLNPYLEFTFGAEPLVINKNGINAFSVSLNLNFLKVYGSNIGISLPLDIDLKNDSIDLDYPSLKISRNLFQEQKAEHLEALSNYYSSLWNLKEVKWSKLKELINDIFNWWYYNELKKLNVEKLEIIKQKMSEVKEDSEKRELKNQILEIQKSLLNYENILKNIDIDCSYELYEEALKSIKELIEEIPGTSKALREDLLAAKYSKEAAFEKSNLWYLPYLPNPSLGITFGYNDGKFDWSISISLSYTLIDHGEKKFQSENRKVDSKIKELDYLNKQKKIVENISTIMNSIDSLMVQKELENLKIEDSSEQLEKDKKLLDKGFITALDFELSRIENEILKVEYQNIENEILIKKIDFLLERGYELNTGGVSN